jgi:hypothetical protein
MGKKGKRPPPMDQAEFLAKLSASYTERMLKHGNRLAVVLPNAARAAQEALAAGKRIEQVKAIFDFTRECGFREAVDLLPPRHLTRAEFDALPVYVLGDTTADGWHRLEIVGTWIIVVNFKEDGMAGFFKPEIEGPPPTPLN